MFRYIIFIVLAVLMLSCGGAQKSTSAAQSVDDVIYAWNDECAGYNFAEYDPGWTMGDAYQGCAYILDEAGLMTAIQNHARVDSISGAEPEIDDFLSEVVEAPEWYR